MNKTNNFLGFLLLSGIFSFTTVGCDIISSIGESFKKKETKQEQKTVQTQKSVPVESKSPSGASQEVVNRSTDENVLASVGKWKLTLEEFKERLKALKEVAPDYDINDPQAQKMVLDELVNQQLLINEAEKAGLVNEKDVVLAVEEFRRTLLVREMVRKLTEDVKVSEEEVQNFYNEKKEILIEQPEWHVREIVVDSQIKANEILLEVLKGKDFAQTAKEVSIGKSAANGGDLGFIKDVSFPEMGSALLSLEPGATSSVFKGPEGFYVIKLEEKKGGQQVPFEKIKEDILRSETARKQQQVVIDFLNKQKEQLGNQIVVQEQLLK